MLRIEHRQVGGEARHGVSSAHRQAHGAAGSRRCTARTMLSKSGIGLQARGRGARSQATSPGQLRTSLSMAGSGVQSQQRRRRPCRPRAPAPAPSRPTVVRSEGRLMRGERPPLGVARLRRRARSRRWCGRARPAPPGSPAAPARVARSPASGSRIMPLKKPEAAPLGRPGRTLTVIGRTLRPAMKPLRV